MATVSTGLATSFIQFSRPGASGGGATVTDRDGKIKWAGHNLLTNSESFDAAAWSKTTAASTVTANAIAAPDGATTADLITASGAVGGVYQSNSRTSSTAQFTLAAFFKAGTVSNARLTISTTVLNNGVVCDFTLTGSGTAGTVTPFGSGWTAGTASITPLSNGWYLCSVTGTAPATGTIEALIGHTAAAVSGNTLYVWGAHLYRSDLGSMQLNPAMPAGMQSYYPTTPRNALGWTEDFSNAYWNKSGGLLAFGSGSVSNAIVAPNGLQTADKLVEDTSTGNHSVYVNTPPTTVANTPYTASVYAKAGERSWIYVRCDSGSAGGVYFNLATGTKGTEESGRVGTITSVGNGWYRCSVTATLSGTSGYGSIHLATADNTRSYTGDGVSGVYVWGAQLSDSASLDTYVPQYGAAVTSAAYYAPRLDFDPVTLAARGLLVEELRSNAVTYSSDFSSWLGSTATVNTNVVTAPDGTLTADEVVRASAASDHKYTGVTFTGDGSKAVSIFVKYNTASTFSVLLFDVTAVASRAEVVFTFTAGVPTATTTSAGSVEAIEPWGNSWYRIKLVGTGVVAANTNRVYVYPAVAGSNNGEKTTFWGAQAEVQTASFSTSLIPTNGATATRAADVASVSTQAFPYSQSEGSYVIAFNPVASDNNLTSFSLTDGSASNRIISSSGPSEHLVVNAGGVSQANIDAGTVTAGAINKLGVAFATNDFAVTIGGGTVGTDTSGSVPIVNRMSIGNYNNASGYLNGWVRQVTYLPRRISNAELQSRTA